MVYLDVVLEVSGLATSICRHHLLVVWLCRKIDFWRQGDHVTRMIAAISCWSFIIRRWSCSVSMVLLVSDLVHMLDAALTWRVDFQFMISALGEWTALMQKFVIVQFPTCSSERFVAVWDEIHFRRGPVPSLDTTTFWCRSNTTETITDLTGAVECFSNQIHSQSFFNIFETEKYFEDFLERPQISQQNRHSRAIFDHDTTADRMLTVDFFRFCVSFSLVPLC